MKKLTPKKITITSIIGVLILVVSVSLFLAFGLLTTRNQETEPPPLHLPNETDPIITFQTVDSLHSADTQRVATIITNHSTHPVVYEASFLLQTLVQNLPSVIWEDLPFEGDYTEFIDRELTLSPNSSINFYFDLNLLESPLTEGTYRIVMRIGDNQFLADFNVVDSLSSADTVNVSLSSANASRGEYVDVVIRLDSNPGISMLLFGMNYDETVLERVSVIPGSIEGITLPLHPGNTNPIRFVFDGDLMIPTTNTGMLATVRFRVHEYSALGISPITLTSLEALGGSELEWEPINMRVVIGLVTVS